MEGRSPPFSRKPETIKSKMDGFKYEKGNFLHNEIKIKGKRNKANSRSDQETNIFWTASFSEKDMVL